MNAIDFGIWLLALAVFSLAFFVDLERFSALRRDEMQLVLGMVVVAVILFVDAIAGLLLGLALLVLFYRTHEALMGVRGADGWAGSFRDRDLMVSLEDYVTPAHLERAQSNTIDSNLGAKMIGIEDPYGGAVYDAQGAFIGMPGTSAMDTPYAPVVV